MVGCSVGAARRCADGRRLGGRLGKPGFVQQSGDCHCAAFEGRARRFVSSPDISEVGEGRDGSPRRGIEKLPTICALRYLQIGAGPRHSMSACPGTRVENKKSALGLRSMKGTCGTGASSLVSLGRWARGMPVPHCARTHQVGLARGRRQQSLMSTRVRLRCSAWSEEAARGLDRDFTDA